MWGHLRKHFIRQLSTFEFCCHIFSSRTESASACSLNRPSRTQAAPVTKQDVWQITRCLAQSRNKLGCGSRELYYAESNNPTADKTICLLQSAKVAVAVPELSANRSNCLACHWVHNCKLANVQVHTQYVPASCVMALHATCTTLLFDNMAKGSNLVAAS